MQGWKRLSDQSKVLNLTENPHNNSLCIHRDKVASYEGKNGIPWVCLLDSNIPVPGIDDAT